MINKLLIAVSGYSGDQAQIENNWPCYSHHDAPVLILSPKDGPIERIYDAKCISVGKKGWIGPHTLERHVSFLRVLAQQSAEFFLFNDSDSVCLSPTIPQYLFDSPDVFWSNEVRDTNPSPSKLPKLAFQPPYFFSRRVLNALLRVASTPAQSFTQPSPEGWTMPMPTECIDHFQLQLVYAANLQHRSFPDGASFETTSAHGLDTMSEHVRAYGKIFIHQIKMKHVLDRLRGDRHIFLTHPK